MPFLSFEGFTGATLYDWAKNENLVYFSLLCLMAVLVFSFISKYSDEQIKNHLTIQVGAWIGNVAFVALTFMNYSKMLDFGSDVQPDTGAFIYIAGNVILAMGLIQAWNAMGMGPLEDALPPVVDYGAPYQGGYGGGMRERQPERYAPPRKNKPKTQAWLVESRNGRSYQLNAGTSTIGRAADNDISIAEPRVSSHHAKIVEGSGHFRILDLGSTNGTWVNGKLVREPMMLYPNDEIRLGDNYKLYFVANNR
jgi:hypothetical protein